ncbi:TPA: DUF1642 domain-containing protein [Listeria monocytogenes]|nr:DUF1642 domain-containing protein [Listeria monocytogenes]
MIQGVVTEIEETKNAISYQIKYSGAMGMTWLDEKELIAPTPVLKVPQFAGDWISRCKQREYDLACLLDYGNAGIPDEMYEWLISSADNQGLLARAWLDGYEVEKEPLYYVKLPYFGYVTNRMDYTLSQSKTDAVMLTESKIKRMDERYWQFAVPVEEAEGEA